jgi:PAS domain S-box-containing protein
MNAINGLMGFIYLTHLSIIPLTQLIMSLFILFYLGGLKGKSKTSRLFTYFFIGNTLFVISFFLYNSVLPTNQYWIAPFTYITLLIALILLLQFTYSFPHPLTSQRLEAKIVLIISIIFLLIGTVLYIHFVNAITSGNPRPIPPMFKMTSFLIALEFLWCLLTPIRRMISLAKKNEPGNWIKNLLKPREKSAKASRDLALILTVPLWTVVSLFLRDMGILPPVIIHYLVLVVTVIFYFALMVVYLNHAPEHGTFMAKLVMASLVIVLTILATVGHLVDPLVKKTYQNENLVSQQQSIYFQPNHNQKNHEGLYITSVTSRFDSQLGRELEWKDQLSIALPFTFPFAGRKWEKLYIHKSGAVTFNSPLVDFAFWANQQVGITPLWQSTKFADESGIYQKNEPGKITITWYNIVETVTQIKFSVQLVLFKNGEIQFNYRDIKGIRAFMAGLFSGKAYGASAKTGIRFSKDPPVSTSTTAVFENYYRYYREYVHQKILPLVVIIIFASLLILVGFPIFFKSNLVEPLQSLLEGVKRVNRGELSNPVPVLYNDEVGIITDSFNRMTQSLEQANRQRREADKAKDNLLALNRSILESAAEGIITLDKNGKVLSFNKAAEEMFKYSREEIIGKPDWRLVKEGKKKKNDGPRGFLGYFIDSGQKKRLGIEREFLGRQKNGQLFPLEFAVSAAVAEGNKEEQIFTVILHDITEHRRMEIEKMQLETQLHQAQKLKSIGTLAGGIAHGFNNILTPIIGYTEMVLDSTPPQDPRQNDLKNILKASNRAKDLVRQLLAFGQTDAKVFQKVDMHSIITEAIKIIRTSIASNIELKLDLDPLCGDVFGDAIELKQVIINLCSNANDAMLSNGGILEVGLKYIEADQSLAKKHPLLKPCPYVMVRVTDTGRGIDRKTINHIFEPFFTTKDVGEGVGLGLSVVHGIVEKHRGVIIVDSIPGKRTTFSVYLPPARGKDPGETTDDEIRTSGEGTILLVGEEEIIVSIHKELLERIGYKVTAETNSLKALEIFRNQADTFHVVITDQSLSNMTGTQLAAEILTIRPKMPIVLCARTNEPGLNEKCRELGVEKILGKPVTINALTGSIRELLTGQDKI